jgi:4-amino-4-deoxy-L-arabinose transferase-like glycosyltransferase
LPDIEKGLLLMNKMNDYLTRFQKSKAKDYVTILLVFILGFAAAYLTATKNHDLSFPPIRSNSDQYDYSNMAYTFMKADIIGKYFTDEYKEPFIEFIRTNRDPLRSDEIKALHRVLDTKNYAKPVPYTYRPWLYPALTGTVYRIFGYSFAIGRMLNIVLFALSAALLFILAYRMHTYLSGVLASVFFILLPNVRSYTEFMLTEVLAVFMVIVSLFAIDYALKKREDSLPYLLLGLSMGLLVLSRQIFLLIIPFVALPIFFSLLKKVSKKAIWNIVFFLFGILFLVLPFFTWNLAITGTTELLTGTQGWNSFPPAYTKEYLLYSEYNFKLRDRIINEYINEHSLSNPQDDIERALLGKRITLEELSDPSVQSIVPRLFVKKIRNELRAPTMEWVLRVFALVGFFAIGYSARNTAYLLFPLANIFVAGITWDGGGRLIIPIFPVIVIFSAIGLMSAIRVLDESIRDHRKKVGNAAPQ